MDSVDMSLRNSGRWWAPWWLREWRIRLQSGRPGFNPGLGRSPGGGHGILLPGESPWTEDLAGYSPRVQREANTTEQLSSKHRRWGRTGKPGVLQPTGSQRAGHDWATEQEGEEHRSDHLRITGLWPLNRMFRVKYTHPLEKEMATHSSILSWKIPWTEESGRLESTGSQKVRHDWVTKTPNTHTVKAKGKLLLSSGLLRGDLAV